MLPAAIWTTGPVPDRIILRETPITGADGVQHPASVWSLWSAEELRTTLSAHPLVPAVVPDGERVVATRYAFDGAAVVEHVTTEPMTLTRAELEAVLIAERERRLAAGFEVRFADARGVHRIGTTKRDLEGWDEVTALAAALRAKGRGADVIAIATDTGMTTVTADEWVDLMIVSGERFRQPIWRASFAVQSGIDAGAVTTAAGIAAAADWPRFQQIGLRDRESGDRGARVSDP